MNKLIDLNLLKQFKMNLDKKITKLDEEQDRKVEAALAEVNGRVEDLSANFTMAADAIGDAIAALDVSVPEGTSLLDIAPIITTHLRKKISYVSRNGSVRVDVNRDHETYNGQISFGYTFPGIPKVTGMYKDWEGITAKCSFSNITRSGCSFTFNFYTGSAAMRYGTVNWTASYSDT